MAAGTKQLSKGADTARSKGAEPSRAESIQNLPARLSAYIEELKREMKLVTWPSREQVRSTTVVVLVTVAFFGVFFGIVDYVLALGQTRLYQMLGN